MAGNNDIFIRLKALLEAPTEANIKKAEQEIKQKLKPIDIKANIDTKNLDRFTQTTKQIEGDFQGITEKTKEWTKSLGVAVQETQKFKAGQKEPYEIIEKTIISQKEMNKIHSQALAMNEKINAQIAKQNQQVQTNQSKYWSQRVKETVSAMTQKPDELAKMADYYKKLEVETNKQASSYNKLNTEMQKLKQNATATNNVLKNFGGDKHHKKADELTTSLNKLNISQNMTQKEMQETVANARLLSNQLNTVSKEAKATGNNSMTMGKMISTAFEKFSIWIGVTTLFFGSIRAIKQAVTEVIELNTAVTELNKVLEVSEQQLISYTEKAYKMGKELGRTGKDVILATAEFARAGYDLSESSKLAEQALLLTNVADGLEDTAEAAGYLIAVMKGYSLTAEDTTHIVNLLNEVSNNYAVNTLKLAEGLQRASGTLSQTGTSVEELTGILTGGFEVLRNMEKVSTGLITISSRLRGVSESGEEIDGLMPKLQKSFKEFAGIDIQTTNGELRSTFDILKDLSGAWSTLNDEQRAKIGELTSGIRQAPVLNAILMNWQSVEGAIDSALNSSNSAIIENEKYLKSLQGRINLLTSALSKLAYNTIDSKLFGSLINLATGFIEIVDAIGVLNMVILTTVAYFSLFKTSLLLAPIINAVTIAISSLTAGLNLSTTAMIRLNTVLGMFAPLAIAIGIMAIVSAIDKANKKIDEFIGNTEDQLIKQKEQINQLEDLKSRYEKTTKSTDDYKKKEEELYKIKEDLVRINPTIIKGIQGEADAHRNLSTEIGNTINKENEYHALFVKNKKIEALANIETLNNQITKKREQIAKGEQDISLLEKQIDQGGIVGWASNRVLPDNATVTNKKINELKDLNEKLKETQRILDILDGKEDVKSVNTTPNINDPFTSTGGTASTSSTPTPYQSKLEEYINTTQLLTEKTAELQQLQKQRDLAPDEKKVELIQKEISLQNELIKLNESLLSQQKQTRQSLADQLSAYSDVVTVADDLETLTVNTDEYNKKSDKQKENIDNLISSFTNLNKSINSSTNAMLDGENALKSLNDEITKINENIIKTSLKSIADSLSSQIKELQNEQKSVIESMEQSLKKYEERQQNRIDRLKEELEVLQRQNDEEDRRLELARLQEQIANTLNNKNIRTLKRMSDGTWDYVYTHDEEKYNTLIKQREELLTEYKRKDIIQAKQDEIKALEDATRKEIQRQKDEINKTKENYDRRISDYQYFKDKLSELQSLTLEEMKTSFDSIIDELKSFTDIWNQYSNSLKPINAIINKSSVGGTVGSSGGSGAGGSSDGNSSLGNVKNVLDKAVQDGVITQEQADKSWEIEKSKYSYHTGLDKGMFVGDIPFDPKTEAIAKLLKGEVVLTQPQFNNIIPNIFKGLNLTNKNPNQQVFNISKLEFPNITNPDGIVDAIKSLPMMVKQRSNLVYER